MRTPPAEFLSADYEPEPVPVSTVVRWYAWLKAKEVSR